jgi:hypothetical protein
VRAGFGWTMDPNPSNHGEVGAAMRPRRGSRDWRRSLRTCMMRQWTAVGASVARGAWSTCVTGHGFVRETASGAFRRSTPAPAIPKATAARLNCRRARRWRNRLTRCPQKALSFGTCGFESHPPHYCYVATRFRPSRAGAAATNRVGCSPVCGLRRSALPARRSSPARTPASRPRSAGPARGSAAA